MLKSVSNFLESPLVHIHFAGFRATTLELQRAGWSLSARESMCLDRYGKTIQLLLQHDAGGLTMVSQLNVIEFGELQTFSNKQCLDIIGVSLNGRSQFMRSPAPLEIDFRKGDFMPIDAMPAYRTVDLGAIKLEEFGVFRKLNDATNIYLPEKTVDQLLNEILEKQAPVQAEIRKNKKRREFMEGMHEIERERKPNDTIRAQIIAI